MPLLPQKNVCACYYRARSYCLYEIFLIIVYYEGNTLFSLLASFPPNTQRGRGGMPVMTLYTCIDRWGIYIYIYIYAGDEYYVLWLLFRLKSSDGTEELESSLRWRPPSLVDLVLLAGGDLCRLGLCSG